MFITTPPKSRSQTVDIRTPPCLSCQRERRRQWQGLRRCRKKSFCRWRQNRPVVLPRFRRPRHSLPQRT
ncbi:MAG: hypothetical protein BJ554DRAFT_6243 [Olpidium bornovanus]|uniref:Uncharacterized protein n=1 Tax=Olpidium bornovanus TaxID=278681 RepID=A0A8H8DKC8_9FUNG|nr:MAG: hypothetical protein BJ554DRAFT_6243 [Olpidium bornovanus]